MTVFVAALWGLAGGVCVEALELYGYIRKTPKWSWRTPIHEIPFGGYVLSIILRCGIGGLVVAAAAAGGQVGGAFGAFGLGVAAPLVIEKLTRAIPLSDSTGVTDPAGASDA